MRTHSVRIRGVDRGGRPLQPTANSAIERFVVEHIDPFARNKYWGGIIGFGVNALVQTAVGGVLFFAIPQPANLTGLIQVVVGIGCGVGFGICYAKMKQAAAESALEGASPDAQALMERVGKTIMQAGWRGQAPTTEEIRKVFGYEAWDALEAACERREQLLEAIRIDSGPAHPSLDAMRPQIREAALSAVIEVWNLATQFLSDRTNSYLLDLARGHLKALEELTRKVEDLKAEAAQLPQPQVANPVIQNVLEALKHDAAARAELATPTEEVDPLENR